MDTKLTKGFVERKTCFLLDTVIFFSVENIFQINILTFACLFYLIAKSIKNLFFGTLNCF